MPLTDEHAKVIEALAKNEDVIGDLYKAYSELIPDYAHYFARMVDEERGHAIWLRRLAGTISNEELVLDKDRFNMDVIERSIAHAQNMEKEAREKGIDAITAASNSAVVENSLLEKKFFEVFEGDSAEVQRILVNLAKASEDHRDHVQQFLEDLKEAEGAE
ncbi:MAG TPA: hypothetical protein VGB30_05320 [bacterium]|jgi:rubrerythrin